MIHYSLLMMIYASLFSKEMIKEFEMSIFGEITFFVDLQIQEMKDDIYITQPKYIKELLKKFGKEDSKPVHLCLSEIIFPK